MGIFKRLGLRVNWPLYVSLLVAGAMTGLVSVVVAIYVSRHANIGSGGTPEVVAESARQLPSGPVSRLENTNHSDAVDLQTNNVKVHGTSVPSTESASVGRDKAIDTGPDKRATQEIADLKPETPAQMRYRWQRGRAYSYRAEQEFIHDDTRVTTVTDCTYSVPHVRYLSKLKPRAAASGFVVVSEGVIATTCAIVSAGPHLHVNFGDSRFPASIIATDQENDLALLRIVADDLPTVTLVNAYRPRHGDTVSVLGHDSSFSFPSPIFGARAHVIISKFRRSIEFGRLRYSPRQFSGGGGGPIVDKYAGVVAVTSDQFGSKLTSSDALATPVSALLTLLKQQQLTPMTRNILPQESQSTLFEYLKLAICRVIATEYPLDNSQELKFTSDVSRTVIRGKSANRDPSASVKSRRLSQNSGTITVRGTGEITDIQLGQTFPFANGELKLAGIERLPSTNESEWQTERSDTITVNPYGPFEIPVMIKPRLTSPYPEPFQRNKSQGQDQFPVKEPVAIAIVEKVGYRRGPVHGRQATVLMTIDLRTNQSGDLPQSTIAGKGHYVFDTYTGTMLRSEMTATLTSTGQDNTPLSIPITYRCVLRDPTEVKEEIARQREKQSGRTTSEAMDPAERIDELLMRIRNNREEGAASTDLSMLAHLPVLENKRADVLKTIRRFQRKGSSREQGSAARVFVEWATENHVSSLWKIARNPDIQSFITRRRAVERLIDFNPIGLYPGLIQLIDDSSVASAAAQGLEEAGSAVEQYILDALKQPQKPSVEFRLVSILGKVGTEKSLPVLEEMLSNSNTWAVPIRSAIRSIRARIQLEQ